jgi:hypothetical protein
MIRASFCMHYSNSYRIAWRSLFIHKLSKHTWTKDEQEWLAQENLVHTDHHLQQPYQTIGVVGSQITSMPVQKKLGKSKRAH